MDATVIGEIVGDILVLLVESRFGSGDRLLKLIKSARDNGGAHVTGRIRRFGVDRKDMDVDNFVVLPTRLTLNSIVACRGQH